MMENTASHLLQIEHLSVQGFRAFDSFELDFHPQATVLVGQNGVGKTSAFAAVGHVLASLVRGLGSRGIVPQENAHRSLIRHFSGAVSRQEASEVAVTAVGWLGGERAKWAARRKNGRLAPERHAKALLERLASPDQILPIMAVYPTSRTWMGFDADRDDAALLRREEGYLEAMEASLAIGRLTTWFRRETYAAGQTERPSRLLAAIKNAVVSGVAGVTDIRYDIKLEEVVVEIDGRATLLNDESDGFRTMIGLVFDIVWRSLVLNPQLGPEIASQIEGIVAVDEIDLHLHPAWQRRIVPDLMRTFPKIQWFFTTHSPQVVGSCRAECIRILARDGKVEKPLHTLGKDTNALLQEVFGADERDLAATESLAMLQRHIDAGDAEAARCELGQLRSLLGAEDRSLIGFEYEIRDLEVHGAADT